MACIFVVVAALEAYVNELYFQPETSFRQQNSRAIKEQWKKDIKKKPALGKFQYALSLWGRDPLTEGELLFKMLTC
jgi:hypothetical protein